MPHPPARLSAHHRSPSRYGQSIQKDCHACYNWNVTILDISVRQFSLFDWRATDGAHAGMQ